MFCPECRGEYRHGIVRCATCGVDLVESLPSSRESATALRDTEGPSDAEPRLSYCGFVALEEARQARDTLRREGIRAEIAILDAPGSDPSEPVREEYWLRVRARDYAATRSLLGFDEPDEGTDLHCSACGQAVSTEETTCPRCGERFDGTG